MQVLLIEDDELKRGRVAEFVLSSVPGVQLRSARSVHSGVAAILAGKVDLVILDMSLPAFDPSADEDGGTRKTYGGREVLRQMEAHDIEAPVIVVTQFDQFGEGDRALSLAQLDDRLTEAHPNYLGAVQYRSEFEGWKDALAKRIRSVTNPAKT